MKRAVSRQRLAHQGYQIVVAVCSAGWVTDRDGLHARRCGGPQRLEEPVTPVHPGQQHERSHAAAASLSKPITAPFRLARNCGDQCLTTTCPPGSTCTLTANCTPRCDPLPVR